MLLTTQHTYEDHFKEHLHREKVCNQKCFRKDGKFYVYMHVNKIRIRQ